MVIQMLTADEFIKREMRIYGEIEIWDLIDKGYVPYLTDRGWRWVLASRDNLAKLEVDNVADFCYSGGVDSSAYSRSSGIAAIGVTGG